MHLTTEQLDYLFSPKAIRDQANQIYKLSLSGKTHFKVHPEKLNEVSEFVLKVIRKNYPDLNIPFHSRWGHFRAGGIKRDEFLNQKISQFDLKERARIKLDLVITSVLLDAGAGMGWVYFEESSKKSFNRSEGLGVASYHMFDSGLMSGNQGLRATSEGLSRITNQDLEKYFQVTEKNPLVGVSGRVQLLKNLGLALKNKSIFQDERPGNILDYLIKKCGTKIPATEVLRAVIDGLGPIWPSRLSAVCEGKEINLGDVWNYQGFDSGTENHLVAFHKLSQWMTYSLIEPIEEAGCEVIGVDQLTGLAEYRNGGLVLDCGLIECRDSKKLSESFSPESDFIIEWRALTIYFLDLLGESIQKSLGKTSLEFPLAKVLEGGTWWAGREIAKEKRSDGGPPIQITSDGTVF